MRTKPTKPTVSKSEFLSTRTLLAQFGRFVPLLLLVVPLLLAACSPQGHTEAPRAEPVILEALTTPAEPRVGEPAEFHIVLLEQNRRPVSILPFYERWLHAVVVSDDFAVFARLHPEDYGVIPQEAIDAAHFIIPYVFPQGGTYLVGLSFNSTQGSGSEEFTVDVMGERNAAPTQNNPPGFTEKLQEVDGYTILLEVEQPTSMKETTELRYTVRREGLPVTDLEPYLGAAMHVVVVREDFQHLQHVRGVLPTDVVQPVDAFGPVVHVRVAFETQGVFHVFAEFSHQGTARVAHHVVEVS
jgi:P-type Cu+ transporter